MTSIDNITVCPTDGGFQYIVTYNDDEREPYVRATKKVNGHNVPMTEAEAKYRAEWFAGEFGWDGEVIVATSKPARVSEPRAPKVEVEVVKAAIMCSVCGKEVARSGKRGRPATMHQECRATKVIEKTGEARVKVAREGSPVVGRPSKDEQVYMYVVAERAATEAEVALDMPQHQGAERLARLVTMGLLVKSGNKYAPALVTDDNTEHRLHFRKIKSQVGM